MPLIVCSDCGKQISDAAPACIHCGRPIKIQPRSRIDERRREPQESTAADNIFRRDPVLEADSDRRSLEPSVFYTLEIQKLVVLSLVTLGLYELYWFYRNWRGLKEERVRDISPFWRAFFAPLWAYSLFREVRDEANAHHLSVRWSGGWLGVLYLLWFATWKLPDPLWLISLLSFVPMIPVQNAINALALQYDVQPDGRYGGRHIAVIIIGGIVLLLAIVGTFVSQ